VDGLQVEAHGRLTSRFEIMAGYALLDSAVVSSAAFPAAVGAQLANVPKHTFTVWSSVKLPGDLEIGAGASAVSVRTASSTVPEDPTTGKVKALPGYWTWNAMARRPLTERLVLQLNVYNLTDAFYFDQLHPAHVVPGAGRSALLDLRVRF
jgi:catecholate siderophore receptor